MRLFRRKAIARADDPVVGEYLDRLMEDGFAHIRQALAPAVVGDVLGGVKQLLQRNEAIFGPHQDADGHYPRIINLHVAHQPLLRLFAEAPLALAVQDAFFGSESVIYTSLYFERGTAQPIHRDTPYFTTRPEYRYLGVWVALEDADERNGCLQVVRRGHRVPELDRPAIAARRFDIPEDIPPDSEELWDDYQRAVMAACIEQGLSVERLPVQAGDVVIWHPQLPHGGSAIGDISRTRHSFVMHVTPEGVPVYRQDVFFNPQKKAPTRARWSYSKYDGRKYVRGDFIDIGAKDRRSVAELR